MDIFQKKPEQPAIKDDKSDDSPAEGDSNKAETDKGKLEEEEAKKIVESLTDSITCGEKKDLEDSTKDIVKKAAHAVGSLKDTEFDIRFNPDVFSPGVKHKDQDGDFFKKQCQLAKDASDFLLTVQIPAFIRDCLDHSAAPMDGQTLSDNLHNRGINIRYIGVIATMLGKVPQLSYIQNLDMTCLSVAVAHFLNCLLSSSPNITVNVPDELKSTRTTKRNKRYKGKQLSGSNNTGDGTKN